MVRRCQFLLFLGLIAAPAAAQEVAGDRPALAAAVRPTADEKQAQEAMKLFAGGVAAKRQGRHLDAIKALEECVRLDPEAAPPHKFLAQLYRIVGRTADALASAKHVVEKHPDDFDGWQRYADLLKEHGQLAAAVQALAKAAECESAAREPEQWVLVLHRLGKWADQANDAARAEAAARKSVEVLTKFRDAFRRSGFLSDADLQVELGDAWERVGTACLKQKRIDAAWQAFRSAASLFDGRDDDVGAARRIRLQYHLAEVHVARGEHEAALGHLDAYLALRPQSVEPYRLLVTAATAARDRAEAVRRLAQHAARNERNVGLQLLLAEKYGELNRFGDAVAKYDELIKAEPKVEYYRGLIKLWHRRQQMRGVLERLDEQFKVADDAGKSEDERERANRHVRAMYAVLRENPPILRALIPLAQDEMLSQLRGRQNNNYKTFHLLGDLAASAGELEAAEELFREGLRRMPFRGMQASIDDPLLRVLRAQRKYVQMLELCNDRLSRPDGFNQFMYMYFKAYPEARVVGMKDALQTAEQAVALAHNEDVKLMARLTTLDILVYHGELPRAIAEAEKILSEFKQPKHLRQARLALSRTCTAAREYARAEQQLRIVLEGDPNDAQASNELGYLLAETGRHLDEAERLVRRALEIDRAGRRVGDAPDAVTDDENAAYLDSLGWVLFHRQRFADARAALEKAAALPDGKDDPTVWDHLGDVRYRQGDAAGAKAAWERAAKLYRDEQRGKKDARYDELRRKLTIAEGGQPG